MLEFEEVSPGKFAQLVSDPPQWTESLNLRQGLDSVGQFYQQLVSQVDEAVGVADGEPYWNDYLNQWQVWVNFADGCRSVVCD